MCNEFVLCVLKKQPFFSNDKWCMHTYSYLRVCFDACGGFEYGMLHICIG